MKLVCPDRSWMLEDTAEVEICLDGTVLLMQSGKDSIVLFTLPGVFIQDGIKWERGEKRVAKRGEWMLDRGRIFCCYDETEEPHIILRPLDVAKES